MSVYLCHMFLCDSKTSFQVNPDLKDVNLCRTSCSSVWTQRRWGGSWWWHCEVWRQRKWKISKCEVKHKINYHTHFLFQTTVLRAKPPEPKPGPGSGVRSRTFSVCFVSDHFLSEGHCFKIKSISINKRSSLWSLINKADQLNRHHVKNKMNLVLCSSFILKILTNERLQ